MSLIQSKSVVTKTTTARLKTDDLKKLIAADLGVDPKSVSLKFDLSFDYSDYNRGHVSGATFNSIEITVTE